jgi:non-specific serine/threonine protein kinase
MERTKLRPGTRVGPYVITSLLGEGGMGRVYRARDPRLGRDVAVKVLSAVPDPDRLSRFELEARATAALAHPNIVTIFDVGTHEGAPFLVTELLEGETLRSRIAAGPIPLDQALELTLALARGTAAAHALRIVHRDLKPENVFLTRDGAPKILDFGLAKLSDASPRGDDATLNVTEAGRVLGTPAYMAPEQLRGEPADPRCDVFALGVILLEMVTGRNPFRKSSVAETLAAVLHDQPRSADVASLPSGVGRCILRCLEKNPNDRLRSADDVASALGSLLSELHRPPPAAEAPAHTAPSIAVLPFADMSPTRDQDWLCEGIAEELINALAHVDGLRVAARTSSFQFKTQAGDIAAIGARLGVATVLEGSVRKLGERLRVTVQLIDVGSGYHLWSERFDRTVADVFAIQDEISEQVATALRGILTPREKDALRLPEGAIDAYEYYLRGRQLFNRQGRATIEQAKTMFERAVELDSGYAPAWAMIAVVDCWIVEWWGGGPEVLQSADRASRRALEIAPELADAHSARGFFLTLSRRYEEAERDFQEAIRLNPHSFHAHYLYARACFAWGRIERSAELFRLAGEARTEDFQSVILLSQSLAMLGRGEEARAASEEGVRRVERQLELDPTDMRALSLGANALVEIGRNEQALAWSNRAIELFPDELSSLLNGVCVRARIGRKEEAFALLERVVERGWGKREWIERDPDYDNLREDPRFQRLLERMP